MKVTAHFHGILAEWVGTRSAVFELADCAVYADLIREVRHRFGGNMPGPADFKLLHGEELTFYLMMAGG